MKWDEQKNGDKFTTYKIQKGLLSHTAKASLLYVLIIFINPAIISLSIKESCVQ